nr:site-specific DNA-methyltransferase [Corallococcus macrosporus]
MTPSRVHTDLRQQHTSQEVDPTIPPLLHTPNFHVSNLDAIDWLNSLPSNSADLVITDPPYESLEKHRAVGTTTRLKHSKSSSNNWFEIFPNRRFPELLSEIYRITKPNRHFYVFCDQETMFILKPLAEATGFKFWKPLIWDKQHIGMGYHYRSRYEFILFFEKGKRRLNNLGIADVISAARVHRGYPTEKPISLLETLISQSTTKDELVVDPFMGSGSTGVAALRNSRRFKGNDISPMAIEIATPRLAQSPSSSQLPFSKK